MVEIPDIESTIHYIEVSGQITPTIGTPGDYPAPTQHDTNASLNDFFMLVKEVVDVTLPQVLFEPAWPDHVIAGVDQEVPLVDTSGGAVDTSTIATPTPQFITTITYRTMRREPGSLEGQPFGGTKEIKPRLRETKTHPVYTTDSFLRIWGQWFDNIIRFEIWAKTNAEADDLVEEFENIMYSYTGWFMKMGGQKMYYYGRGQDEAVLKWRTKIPHRYIEYFVRTERLYKQRVRQIKTIHTRLQKIQGNLVLDSETGVTTN